jgi:hypothetical protein
MRAIACLCLVPMIGCFIPTNNSGNDSGSENDSSVEIQDSGTVDSALSLKDTAVNDSRSVIDSTIVDSNTIDTATEDSTINSDSSIADSSIVDAGPDTTLPNQNGISYNGGPVMTGLPVVYFIWYGNWANNTTMLISNLMATLAAGTSVAGQDYLNTVSTYYEQETDGGLNFLSGKFVFGGNSFVPATSTNLSQSDVGNVAYNYTQSQGMTAENINNGIFFVLTAPDIQQNAPFGTFCSSFCGWHDVQNLFAPDAGTDAGVFATQVFGFIGDPDVLCPTACEWPAHLGMNVSPNGNTGADAMINIIMHELAESLTDPQLNAWTNPFTGEIGDRCDFIFGPTCTTANSAIANINIGGNDYLIQELWDNVNGTCVMSTP